MSDDREDPYVIMFIGISGYNRFIKHNSDEYVKYTSGVKLDEAVLFDSLTEAQIVISHYSSLTGIRALTFREAQVLEVMES